MNEKRIIIIRAPIDQLTSATLLAAKSELEEAGMVVVLLQQDAVIEQIMYPE